MKLVLQIAAGILIAGFISWACWLLLVYIGARELERQAVVVSQDAQRQVEQRRLQAAEAAKRADWERQARSQAQRWQQEQREQALRLAPDQTCVGAPNGKSGTVIVRTVENGVVKLAQLLENFRPVPCEGDHRLR